MAQAAESQANWTKAQFWITFAEVIGLVLIIFYTAKTARDASKSAAATTAANEIARDTGKRQLRAYVNIQRADAEISPGSVKASVRVVNRGQTPAYDVQHWMQIGVGGINKAAPFGDVAQSAVLGHGDGFMFVDMIDLTDYEANEIRERRLPLCIAGLIRYKDAFGENRDTRYQMTLDVFTSSFAPDHEGNEAT